LRINKEQRGHKHQLGPRPLNKNVCNIIMSRRVGLNSNFEFSDNNNNNNLNEQMLKEAEKKRMNTEKKYSDAKKERSEMEKVAQTFIIYAAVKTAEEKARVEMEKAKKESNKRAETKAKSKIKKASEKITKILKNGREVADLFFKLVSIWANANNGKKRKSIEATAKQLAINAKKAEEKARIASVKASANAARNERARRQFLRRQRELEQEETKENAKKEAEARRRKAEENAKKEAEARRRKAEENAKKEAEARRRKAEENAKIKAEAQRRKQKYTNSNNVYKEAIQKLQNIKSSRMLPKKEKLKQGRKVFIKASLILHPNKGGKEELFKNLSSYYNNFEKM